MWLAITFLFGLGFIGLEVKEFAHLVADGNGPERSAFLSSFFLLVATHGCHVTAGLLWMATLMFQMGVMGKDLNTTYMSRLTCLSLFWHFPGHRLDLRLHGRLSDGGHRYGPQPSRAMATARHSCRRFAMAASAPMRSASFSPSSSRRQPSGWSWRMSCRPAATVTAIAILAAVQVMVHLVCFLHLNFSSEQRWNVTAFAFAVLVVGIVIIGSLWIIHNMTERMMPQMQHMPSLQQQP